MLFPNPIARLRKAHYALEDLPDAVTFPKHPARESDAPLPLEEATVDDIAFAIVAADQESIAASNRASALTRPDPHPLPRRHYPRHAGDHR